MSDKSSKNSAALKNRRKLMERNTADPLRKQKGAFCTQPISQRDADLDLSEVALPDEDNVEEARDWVNFNKK